MPIENSAHQIGEIIGLMVWSAICLAIAFAQKKNLRTDGVSKFAALGLILWSLGLLFLTVTGWAIKKYVDLQHLQIVSILVSLTWFSMQIASFCLSAIGAFEIFFSKPSKRGKHLVVWSFLLGFLISGLVGLGFYKGLQKAALGQNAQTPEIRGFDPLLSNVSKTQSGAQNNGLTYEFEDENFGLLLNSSEWTRIDHSKSNPDASIWLLNKSQKLNLLVVAEPLGYTVQDFSIFESVIESALKENLSDYGSSAFEDIVISGKQMRRLRASGRIGVMSFDYGIHVFEINGMLYQLNFSSPGLGSMQGKGRLIESYIDAFYILDDRFFPGADEGRMLSQLESADGAVTVDLSKSNWLRWTDMSVDAPYLDQGAVSTLQSAIGTVVLQDLHEGITPLDVLYGFCQQIGLDKSHVVLSSLREVEISNFKGYEIDFEKDADGKFYDYTVRFTKIGSNAVLVFGSRSSAAGKLPIFYAMESIRIDRAKLQATRTFADADTRIAYANAQNGYGLYYYTQGRYEEAAWYFERAHRTNPDLVVSLINLAMADSKTAADLGAVMTIRNSISKHPDSAQLHMYFGIMLAEEGLFDEALPRLKHGIEGGYDVDDDLLAVLTLLVGKERFSEAVELSGLICEMKETVKRVAWRLSILRLAGKLEEAQKELVAAKWKYDDRNLLLVEEGVRIALDSKDYEGAIKQLDAWEARTGPTPSIYQLKTLTLIGLEQLTAAKSLLIAALEDNPRDSNLLNLQRYLNSQLGEDDLDLVTQVIKPLNRPDAVEKLIEASKTTVADSESSQYDYRLIAYEFEEGKQFRYNIVGRVQIQDRTAVEDFSTLIFNFDRSYERLYVNHIRVLNQNGKLLWEQEREAFYISEDSDANMASDASTLYTPVGSLVPGTILEWEVTWETLSKIQHFPFRTRFFAKKYPMKNQFIYVTGDLDKVSFATNGMEQVDTSESGVLAWQITDVPSFYWEKNVPELATFLPYVRLSSSELEWSKIASDYYADISDFLDAESGIDELLTEVDLSGLEPVEIVRKLLQLVNEHVVYKALEFGVRGRIPERALTTWNNRYGDCKDQAILLHQLLKAVGIESHPFLVSTKNSLEPAMPSLEQFNHMILYIPVLSDQPFVDPVDANFDFTFGPPSGLGGRSGLVIKAKDPIIMDVPDYAVADEPNIQIESLLSLNGDEDQIDVFEKLSLSGYLASLMRKYYQALTEDRHSIEVNNYLYTYLPKRVDTPNVVIRNLRDSSAQLIFELKYSIPVDGKMIDFSPLWEQYYMNRQPDSERKHPYKIYYPFNLESTVYAESSELTVGFDPVGPKIDFENFVTIKGVHSDLKRKSILKAHWSRGVLKSEEYRQFYNEIESVNNASYRVVEIK